MAERKAGFGKKNLDLSTVKPTHKELDYLNLRGLSLKKTIVIKESSDEKQAKN